MNIDTRDPLLILIGLIIGFTFFGAGLVLLSNVLMIYTTALVKLDSAWALGVTFFIVGLFALTLGFHGLVDLSIERVTSKSKR